MALTMELRLTETTAPFVDTLCQIDMSRTLPIQIAGTKYNRYDVRLPNTTPLIVAPKLGKIAMASNCRREKVDADKMRKQLTILPTISCGPETTSGMRKAIAGKAKLYTVGSATV